MAGPPPAPADLFVVGANHRSSSVGFRDRLFVEDAALPELFGALRAAGIDQAVALSTCDRVEIQGAHADAAAAAATAGGLLLERAGLAESATDRLYCLTGGEAARQIFAVAASLDSVVVGETQVAGQVRAAHRLAKAAEMVGAPLDRALQAAFAAAKRVRNETAIGEGPVSMAAAAVELARNVHGDLGRCAALLLGSGEMGEALAERLLATGLERVVVAHPVADRAAALARRLGCHHRSFDDFVAALADADIVITALGDGRTAIGAEAIEGALRRRRHRPIFLLDTAVPPDVAPAVNRIDDAFLYDLDDLEQVALRGRGGRKQAAEAAWAIVEEELAAFEADGRARRAVPAIVALRQAFEAARRDVLDGGAGSAEEATRRLVARLLHEPSAVLRALDDNDGGAEAERLLRRLFRLDDTGADDEERKK